MKISLSFNPSCIVQDTLFVLYFSTSCLYGFKSSREVERSHFESLKIMVLAQAFHNKCHIAIAAAQAHEIIIF
jgi:hypothetical protein